MRRLILILLICLQTLYIAADNHDSAKTTLKLYNSGINYLADLQQTGLVNDDLSAWLGSDVHVIIMGNVLDTENDLAAQIGQLQTIAQLARANNSTFSVLRGQNEYKLATSARLTEDVASWLNSLDSVIISNDVAVSYRGLSLTAVSNDNNNIDMAVHHPVNYMGNQICHPLFEAERLRQALRKNSATKLFVTQAQDFQVPWQKRLSDQLHILNKGVVATITHGRVSVKLVDGTDILFAEVSPSRYPETPVGMSEKEILDILRNGEVIGEEAIPVGITKPMKLTLSYNGKQLDAAFKNYDDAPRNEKSRWKPRKRYADRYIHEVAAYKLDRKLGIGLVPITIERIVDGSRGSLQVWYDGLVSKLSYREAGENYQGHCDRKAQRNMMRVFDYLIMNDDRNQSNILHNKDDWQVWFIDHSRSFSDSIRRNEQMSKADDIYLTPEFRKVLEATDRGQLNSLRPYLHKRRIKIIDRRRELLLSGEVNDM